MRDRESEFTPRVERHKQPAVGDVVHVVSFQPDGRGGSGRKVCRRAVVEAVYAGTRADLLYEDHGNPLEPGHPGRYHHLTNMPREDAAGTVGTWHPVKPSNGVCGLCGRSLALDAAEAAERAKPAALEPVKIGDTVHIVRHRGEGESPRRFEKLNVEAKVTCVHPLGKFIDAAIGEEKLLMSPRDDNGEIPDSWHLPEKPRPALESNVGTAERPVIKSVA